MKVWVLLNWDTIDPSDVLLGVFASESAAVAYKVQKGWDHRVSVEDREVIGSVELALGGGHA